MGSLVPKEGRHTLHHNTLLIIPSTLLQVNRCDVAQTLIKRGVDVDALEKWSKEGRVVYESTVALGGTPRRPGGVKPVRTPVAILGSLGVCIYVQASRHWLISYSPIHLT